MAFEILVVDDEVEVCLSLGEVLTSRGYRTLHLSDPQEVIAFLERRPVNLVIMDVRMPALGGIDLLRLLRKRFALLPVIMISGYASVEAAVRAMRYGALNFYTKPIQISHLLREIRQLERSALEKRSLPDAEPLLSSSPRMLRLLSLAEKAAPTDTSVLINGESGTGKELIADLLHGRSARRDSAYIKVNCAAIPDSLLESEMFGHEKGAFTDASSRQRGKVELADGGTIFLDEIGDMSLRTQAKMLRVLQEKRFTRVGGVEPIPTDFRIIAATNRDLHQMIREGSFREDLYYRLSVITLDLPALRERPDDIVPLAEHFLRRFNVVHGRNVAGLSDAVVEILRRHDWPGNVRELKNIMERAVIFCEGEAIEPCDLPEQYAIVGAAAAGQERLREAAKAVIREALKESNGIKGEAARLLHITRRTLYNRMKRLNLE